MEVGCTSVFGVGERDFGVGKGCGEWEMMGEEGKGLEECDIHVVKCWVLLSHELLNVGLALPAVGRASTVTHVAVGTTQGNVFGLKRSL